MQEISVHQFQTQGGGGVVIHRNRRVGMVMNAAFTVSFRHKLATCEMAKAADSACQVSSHLRCLSFYSRPFPTHSFTSAIETPTITLFRMPSSLIGKWTLSLLSSQPLLPLKDDTYHFNYLLHRMDLLISEINQCNKRSSLLRAEQFGLCEREPWENAPCS